MSKIYIRIPQQLLDSILLDLRRPHKYTYERVGFCYGHSVITSLNEWVVILNEYKPVKDENYIKTSLVGARINSAAITEGFQFAYSNSMSLFHIHLHDFEGGRPEFSYDDLSSGSEIIESMSSFVNTQIHGLIVLNKNSCNAMALISGDSELQKAEQITVVGAKLNLSFPKWKNTVANRNNRYSRQLFLGKNAEKTISNLKIGVVGLSGGGSHIVQQLAHIGFKKYVLADPDIINDDSNLNRVVGATIEDAKKMRSKFAVFERLVRNLHPRAEVLGGKKRWEELFSDFKSCDIIFGCLDTVIGRRDLENFCRRYLIEYIDIGMGVETSAKPFSMFGQIQLSIPGHPCLMCNGFITDESLKNEANNYGQKTKRPQVVWPNGILASTAIGIAMDLITNWTSTNREAEYLSYNGNDHTISDHLMKDYRKNICPHYPISESGPIVL